MRFIADLHVHSHYSRATSKDMEPGAMAEWADLKGIGVVGTGDFTHPLYFEELRRRLDPAGEGLFSLREGGRKVRFMLTAEVCHIFPYKGGSRRIHCLILAPSFEAADRLNSRLSGWGKLTSDGRPIFSRPAKDLVKAALDVSKDFAVIPAHAWTPWFSIFGASSGFNSIGECFEEETGNIFAIETGLSSDPAMNWRLSRLDGITLVSNSDAHSPSKIGREANVFDCGMSYAGILDVLRKKDKQRFLFTVEFFPEEGKYHFDGHRNCKVALAPAESRKGGDKCPKCGRKLTVGVMHRVEDLADRPDGFKPANAIPFRRVIPLAEIIAEAMGQAVDTRGVDEEYRRMVARGGSEFSILLDLPIEELTRFSKERVAEGVRRMREGKVKIAPGHDGEFGKVTLFDPGEEPKKKQMSLF